MQKSHLPDLRRYRNLVRPTSPVANCVMQNATPATTSVPNSSGYLRHSPWN
ncbi:hypothetical protein RMSM_01455 [Rhodopirellula maiorica SM1]|uniref:Uncharacterized protein n=2 Tax=Novipirellula TaxID=2795426 RepID=M5S5Z6_9BACT|nr:hypothetical protein RMSM_01455 [Rhodopirellula maiorica SM1]